MQNKASALHEANWGGPLFQTSSYRRHAVMLVSAARGRPLSTRTGSFGGGLSAQGPGRSPPEHELIIPRVTEMTAHGHLEIPVVHGSCVICYLPGPCILRGLPL